ncbi:MAG: hypothetical protein R2761_27830 [Acidimicrobiales bacterium]
METDAAGYLQARDASGAMVLDGYAHADGGARSPATAGEWW